MISKRASKLWSDYQENCCSLCGEQEDSVEHWFSSFSVINSEIWNTPSSGLSKFLNLSEYPNFSIYSFLSQLSGHKVSQSISSLLFQGGLKNGLAGSSPRTKGRFYEQAYQRSHLILGTFGLHKIY